MTTPDCYGQAGKIALRMEALGHPSWRAELERVAQGGGTGTEILMGLRYVLEEYLVSGLDIPADLQAEVKNLIRDINRSLAL